MGRGRMECRLCVIVLCVALEHILLPPLPRPALRSGAGSTMASTIMTRRGPALLCLCQRGWCSTPEVCQDCQRFLPLLCHSDRYKSPLQLFWHTVRLQIVASMMPKNSKSSWNCS